MRQLLEDRFRLKAHRKTRDTAVFFLTVAKGGPKLTPAREGSCIRLDPSNLSQAQPPDSAHVCGFPKRFKNGTIEDATGSPSMRSRPCWSPAGR